MRRPGSVGLEQFLREHPQMSIAPSRESGTVAQGIVSFSARSRNGPEISDSFELRVLVPEGFPAKMPLVTETGRRIPRTEDYHVNKDDTLCLGSPLRLLSIISDKPNLVAFVKCCLIPYLYAVSIKLRDGGPLRFGELAHAQ